MTVHKLFNEDLEKAIKARKEFLDSLPPEQKEKMLKIQKEIDDKLSKAGNQYNRIVVCREMMLQKLAELNQQLQEFRGKD
jgi:hypothetical protein